ncbi:MAG: hypothetical protein GPJ54_04310 [Candidatus Heimdallarchaeota archaeon]|nr:hypothetical protein [Candidatus Heimdallarchaeota archaeon]
MSSTLMKVQLHCDRCADTAWYEIYLPTSNQSNLDVPSVGSGLVKKSLNHGDHVVIADIDYNGAVRTVQIVDIHFTRIETLIEDIAQGFYFYMNQSHRPLYIDVFTTNPQLVNFFQKLISQLFVTAIHSYKGSDQIVASTLQGTTRLYSEKIQMSVGTSLLEDTLLKDSLKGVILDISDVKKDPAEIITTLDLFDWCVVLLEKESYEGYEAAFSSIFKAKGKPYFIDVLNNQTMINMFEFVFANVLNFEQENPNAPLQ